MTSQPSPFVRLAAIGVLVIGLLAAAAEPAAAQREPRQLTRAQQIRELVLKQRERVLSQIDAIFSGERDASQQAQVDPVAEGDATAEESEPEGGEAEGEEPEGAEEEADEAGESEAEDEGVLELPETGAGQPRDAERAGSALMTLLGILAAASLCLRRRINSALTW